jgi:hypothetical protein
MTLATVILLSFVLGWALGTRSAPTRDDRLSHSQLADMYRREHQRTLDGRAAPWE